MAQLHVCLTSGQEHAIVVEPVTKRTPYEVLDANDSTKTVKAFLEVGDWRCEECGARGHQWTEDEMLERIVVPVGEDPLEALAETEGILYGGVRWGAIREGLNDGDSTNWSEAQRNASKVDRLELLSWIRGGPDDDPSPAYDARRMRFLTWAELRGILLEVDRR